MEELEAYFHCYAICLRGFCHSSLNKEIFIINDFVEDIKLFIDQLNIEKFSVLGFQYGGGIA